MPVVYLPRKSLRGLSFKIAELTLLKAWSEAQDLRMCVQLDHGVENEEYEEVLAFSRLDGGPCQWIMWRNAEFVFVQPLIGRTQRYESVAGALDALTPKEAVQVTDIKPTGWPS